MSEGFPLTRVIERPVQGCRRNLDATHCHTKTFLSKILHKIHKALSFNTQHVFCGHFYIYKRQLSRVLRVHSQLVQVATTFKTFHASLKN
mgnify:CR=1 FL=1